MRVAAVIAGDGDHVVPLPEGPVIRIMETETGHVTEISNPAFGLERDRRPTAARALVGAGVNVAIAPPRSFCSPSHKIASTAGIRFWPVPEGSRWSELWMGRQEPPAGELRVRLPKSQLLRQDLDSVVYYAKLAMRRQ